MAKGDKSVKLDFDLDGNGSAPATKDTDVPALEEDKATLEEARKWEAYTLPIKVTDGDGNFTYQMKQIENVSVDEFVGWMREVLPVSDEYMKNNMRLGKANEKLANLKFRREIFNGIIKMHEMRYLLGLGKDKLPKDLATN